MNFKYRPEIDGLRAIAVFSVIFYHADFQIQISNEYYALLPGGFLGVDIFYVISGYLITFLIFERINKNSFSFADFYERRARRLLPTLFFIITISLIAGWIFMLPNQMKDLAGSALSSLVFLSNFWFLVTDNYFAESSSLKPLLHTWSLSIEEQFYLIFPPILYFLYKKKIKNIKLIFFGLIVASLSFATFLSIYFVNLNFYILPTRVWELMVGALIAYYHVKGKTINKKISSNFFTLVGIILIFLSFFLFNEKTPHPSILTIFTILGTAIIILNNRENNFIKKLLSTKLLVGAGLISYSLYLWHFPILAFKKVKTSTLSEFDKFEAVLLAIVLSILSYYFIEKPFRNKKLISKNYFLTFLSIFFIILFISCSYVYKKNGLPQRYSETILQLVDFNYDYSQIYQTGKCHIDKKIFIKKNLFENCLVEIEPKKDNLYLWGDSLAAHLYPGINHKYKKKFNIWHRSVNACKPSVLNFNYEKKDTVCKKANKFILNEIINVKPDKIFISAFWLKKDLKELKKLVEILNQNKITNIYLVGPSVRWHDPLPKILLKKYKISKEIPKYLYDKNHENNFKLDREFSNFAKKNSINYVSPIQILCRENFQCLTKVGDEADSITNWDENHFTEKASKFIFSKFID